MPNGSAWLSNNYLTTQSYPILSAGYTQEERKKINQGCEYMHTYITVAMMRESRAIGRSDGLHYRWPETPGQSRSGFWPFPVFHGLVSKNARPSMDDPIGRFEVSGVEGQPKQPLLGSAHRVYCHLIYSPLFPFLSSSYFL